MVLDPSTFNKPVTVQQWKESLIIDKNKELIEIFYTNRFNYLPIDKYTDTNKYSDLDNDRMMSALDKGMTTSTQRKK